MNACDHKDTDEQTRYCRGCDEVVKVPVHQHHYTVVVEWELWDYIDEEGNKRHKISNHGDHGAYSAWPIHKKATKVMCECGEVKELWPTKKP